MNRKAWLRAISAVAACWPISGIAAPAGTGTAGAPPPAEQVFMTGADPISPAEYASLPKLGQFRAWLPKRIDLSRLFPAPGHQGPQPNCVAWATTYAAHSFLNASKAGRQPAAAAEQMSPAYVYNRLRQPGSLCNRAIRIVDALNLLQREGAVSLEDFPDDITKCNLPAPEMLLGKASAYRLAGWRAVDREKPDDWTTPVVLDDIKGALARGEPVVFAMPVMDDFKAMRGDAVYTHLMPESVNWHAMTLLGYDEDRQAFRAINSWGHGWGDGGYIWIDYATFRLLAGEAYALQGNPPPVPSPGPAPAPAPVDPRKTLDAQLAALPCGTVKATNEGGRLNLSGFGGDAVAIERLRQTALAVDASAAWRVAHHPWPQCEAQLTLQAALAQGGVEIVARTGTGRTRRGNPVEMKAGDIFGITARVPADKPHLSIVYLQADGSAVELYRGTVQAGRDGGSVSIGLGGTRETRFQVGEPFGHEMIIALASDRPLAADELKDHATERQFLTGLRARLALAGEGTVSAAVLRIHTGS